MIFCFSGTGNSRYIARRFAEALKDTIVDLNAKIKAQDNSLIQTGKNVIIVVPTYAWRIPRVVSEWLTNNMYDHIMSELVNPIFYQLIVKADSFYASEICIGCGQCVLKCPLNNVQLRNGKPVWGKKCTHCMACICYCPTKAIEYGKKSRGKPRYCFEKLELK